MASPAFREFLDEGKRLESSILVFLDKWPRDDSEHAIYWGETPASHQAAGRELVTQARQWFNSFSLVINRRFYMIDTCYTVRFAKLKRQYENTSIRLQITISKDGLSHQIL